MSKDKEFWKFFEAQAKAELENKQEFCCPLCGGLAEWYRSDYNGHLHCWCNSCGIKVME